MSLATSLYDEVANDLGSAWCEATTGYATGNFGTPGALSDRAQSCP